MDWWADGWIYGYGYGHGYGCGISQCSQRTRMNMFRREEERGSEDGRREHEAKKNTLVRMEKNM